MSNMYSRLVKNFVISVKQEGKFLTVTVSSAKNKNQILDHAALELPPDAKNPIEIYVNDLLSSIAEEIVTGHYSALEKALEMENKPNAWNITDSGVTNGEITLTSDNRLDDEALEIVADALNQYYADREEETAVQKRRKPNVVSV